MYDNIGGKLMKLAKILAILGMVGFGILTLVTWFAGGGFFAGLLTLVVGCLCSWLSGFAMYAFGNLVDNTAGLNRELAEIHHLMKRNS